MRVLFCSCWCKNNNNKNKITKAYAYILPPRDHFVYVLSQWETTLHCNVVSHWLSPYHDDPCFFQRNIALLQWWQRSQWRIWTRHAAGASIRYHSGWRIGWWRKRSYSLKAGSCHDDIFLVIGVVFIMSVLSSRMATFGATHNNKIDFRYHP